MLPVVFVAHGAPTLALDREKGAHLRRWAEGMPRPKAILAVSAHWQTRDPTIGATTPQPLLYDFSGFPPELSEITYWYEPAPELADRVERLLGPKLHVTRSPDRRLDHGVWVPLLHMYPQADVPILQLSLPRRPPEDLFALGKALAPLRDEGVLVMTTGVLVHNLRRVDFHGAGATPKWALEFDAWCADALVRGDIDALLGFRVRAPGVALAHPTDEHFVPLLVAVGAASVTSYRVSFPVLGFEMSTLSRRCVQFDARA